MPLQKDPDMPPENSSISGSVALIHTVASLIPVFEPLAKRDLVGWTTFNMLDESLLRTTIAEGSLSRLTMRRLTGMVWSAVDAGAVAVVVTCSSLGPAVEAARPLCPVRLFRIDEGMAIAAVGMGARVGVLATLRTTLEPTADLIRQTAMRLGHHCSVHSALAAGAFEKLTSGDADAHDQIVAQSLRGLAAQVDVIVLAQASMARVLPMVSGEVSLPVLTSPELGLRYVAECLPNL